MGPELPSGTVTFLFTDVEGSTRLLDELGAEAYAEALAEHRRVLRAAFAAHGGVEVDTQGDAFFVAFPTAPGALHAAGETLAGLAPGPIRVRIGIHTGTPHLAEEGYVGVDVHRAARIAAAGHGGQVLVSAATAALAGCDGLRDLGEHRLKDLAAPERIYQLGEGEFPSLKSLHQTNLPVPATPFLGREKELTEVLGLLEQENVRLLTLTGPGGTGKTRLGLQAAAETAERRRDGVFWVPLAPLRDPELVLETARQALGATDGLAEHIGDRSLLLLFDNFEHVVEAAAGLSELLASCPNLGLLVTSREVLRLPGEQVYPVPPLEPQDGRELFLARARGAEPGFAATAAVRELCARLDNLPLALELAAARVRVLSAEQLLERLGQRLDLLRAGRGVDARQQTLRATIEWSHDLLDANEQQLFARLAVFSGGCTLESAEEVCDADVDTLQSLVDKSLLRVREGDRFWMLGTIREYALERLEASGEADEIRRRHAQHFLALAEKAEPSVLGSRPAAWLDRLELEHDNLRAALDWFETSRDTQHALLLGGTIWEFWCLRAHYAEGWRRLERLLELDERPTLGRAKALTGAGHLAPHLAEAAGVDRIRREQALELHRRLGDPWGIAFAEYEYSHVFTARGDFATARPLMEDSVRRFRELGDEHRALQATRALAWCNLELGEIERAKRLYQELLDGARAAGDRSLEARALGTFAVFASDEGRHTEALDLLQEAYRIGCEFGDPSETAMDLIRFGRALAMAERPKAAVQLLACAEARREEIGMVIQPYVIEYWNEAEARARARLDEAAFVEAWEQGRRLSPDDAVAIALSEAR
jgi:predicted ATPase